MFATAMTAMTTSVARTKGRVLVVDDDESLVSSWCRMLEVVGFETQGVTNPMLAPDLVSTQSFDAVIADVQMPELDGTELVRILRGLRPDLPVVLSTGAATIASATKAIERGAYRYLLKPVDPEEMITTLNTAIERHRRALEERGAMREHESSQARRRMLESGLNNALATMWIAFQPIVDRRGEPFGYEALLRAREPSLPHPGAIIGAAEQLGRLEELGRTVREVTARAFKACDPGAMLFVNLVPSDLFDDTLGAGGPFDDIRDRVVLEITERSSLHHLNDVEPRVDALRRSGLRIAIDDLGAGYAGLTSFAILRPDVAKIDMSLVRSIDTDRVKQRLITSIVKLCEDLGVSVVAEGIETVPERDTLLALGVHYFQGYLIGRPEREFAKPRW